VPTVPTFAITLTEAIERVQELQRFVREQMVEGVDYGRIPNTPKPTLFKAGAEKLAMIYGLAIHAEVQSSVEQWEEGFVAYTVKTTLVDRRSGLVVAEGLGHCNSRERRYARQQAADIANTVLKMAKKRALVDAVLSATRSSGIFTQDTEDLMDPPAPRPRLLAFWQEAKALFGEEAERLVRAEIERLGFGASLRELTASQLRGLESWLEGVQIALGRTPAPAGPVSGAGSGRITRW